MTSDTTAVETTPTAAPFELSWDKLTTPLEAIERATYALADQLTGQVADTDRSWTLTVYPRAAHANPDVLAHRLRQDVNDQVLRVRIAERTDPVRNLVFALAFSRSGVSLDPTSSDGGAEEL